MAELVDAHDSNSCSARSVGSIPTPGTDKQGNLQENASFVEAFLVSDAPAQIKQYLA